MHNNNNLKKVKNIFTDRNALIKSIVALKMETKIDKKNG